MEYIFLILAVFFTAVSQLLLKSQLNTIGFSIGSNFIYSVVKFLFSNPVIIVCMVSTVIGILCWIGALSKLNLSFAFPVFTVLTFLVVLSVSFFVFKEPFTLYQGLGILLMIAGISIVNIGN